MHEWPFQRRVGDGRRETYIYRDQGLCRVHYGLIHGLYGEDTLEAWMTMGEESHEGGPSESATIVVVRLDRG